MRSLAILIIVRRKNSYGQESRSSDIVNDHVFPHRHDPQRARPISEVQNIGFGLAVKPPFASTWPRLPSLSMAPKSPHHRFNFSTSNALIIVSYSSLVQLDILSVTDLSVGPNSNLKQSQVSPSDAANFR